MMSRGKIHKRWGTDYSDKRNWPVYNKQLVRRGEMYISFEFLDSWDDELRKMNKGKVGRKFNYPEKFIKWTALVYHAMNMSYRTLQGYLRGLSRYIPKIKAADYSTLCRRISDTNIDLINTIPDVTGDLVISVDSSGVKVTNRGEWIRKKWRKDMKSRGWIKVHVAVDVQKKEILAIEISDQSLNDEFKFKDLMKQCRKNIKDATISRVLADGAYDRRFIYRYLKHFKIQSGIKMRRDAVLSYEHNCYRNECVWDRNEMGHDAWVRKVDYTKRWISESMFSSVKRMFGESVKSKSVKGCMKEAYRKFVIYNALNNFGKGKIKAI